MTGTRNRNSEQEAIRPLAAASTRGKPKGSTSQARELAKEAGATMVEGSLNFLDPCGNRVEVVEYRDVQFTKANAVLDAMKLSLDKSHKAKAELIKKGIGMQPV